MGTRRPGSARDVRQEGNLSQPLSDDIPGVARDTQNYRPILRGVISYRDFRTFLSPKSPQCLLRATMPRFASLLEAPVKKHPHDAG